MTKLSLFFTCAMLVAFVSCDDKNTPPYFKPDAKYISNGIVKLGVDMSAGGSIFYFSEVAKERNLLNHNDKGRFIQQSYYGEPDGSIWSGMDWCWNPIQGGGTHGEPATVLASDIGSDQLYVKTLPKQWSTGADVPEALMEEWITLEGNVAKIHFRMSYTGTIEHPKAQQELPAIFVDADLPNLYYYVGDAPWTNAPLSTHIPGWPNEYMERDEDWSAYVDNKGWGIGVYTPNTTHITCYRFTGGNTTGPSGSQCSYFAPLQFWQVTPGLVFEYDVYVTIGTLDEIRARFYDIRAGL